jgi:methionyl-tRNA synthetase
MPTTYITVAIPYVNAAPHLGYAFELVEADVFARAARRRGERVRFLGGTDDYSLKNVLAATASGAPIQAFVDAHADRFAALGGPLELSFDDFIHTSRDPRHRPAVERLWRACDAAGDLYERHYEGDYCVGCEEFLAVTDLVDGRCPEHGTPTEHVRERNWFFRLSRHAGALIELIEGGTLQITPDVFRDEVLAFLRRGLNDISVSRSVHRARGWGIPVPGDPDQVVYVWFDALTNYLSALGYGDPVASGIAQWWTGADRRIHVIGKGIVRFHAVYWPAFLLAAGEPLPTEIHVHPYLTAGGVKLSKSRGATVDPVDVVERFGTDRLRWWLCREPAATSDTDFTVERLVQRVDHDLANGIGNAINRVVTLAHRHRAGTIPDTGAAPLAAVADLASVVDERLARFDRRGACAAIVDAIDALNRDLDATQPWHVARDSERADELDRLLDRHHCSALAIAVALAPIVPSLAAALCAQLTPRSALPEPRPTLERLTPARR